MSAAWRIRWRKLPPAFSSARRTTRSIANDIICHIPAKFGGDVIFRFVWEDLGHGKANQSLFLCCPKPCLRDASGVSTRVLAPHCVGCGLVRLRLVRQSDGMSWQQLCVAFLLLGERRLHFRSGAKTETSYERPEQQIVCKPARVPTQGILTSFVKYTFVEFRKQPTSQ